MRTGAALTIGALLAAGLLAAACGGGEKAQPLPQIREAIATRDVVNGEALPSSSVTVRLDRDFTLVEGRTPLASHFEFWIPDLRGNVEGPVFVRTAEQDQVDRRLFRLSVDRLLPEDTVLRIERKAFRAGAEGVIEGKVETSLSASQVFFATTLFQFGDPALTSEDGVAEASDPNESDVAVQREALQAHLAARHEPPEVIATAIARFDSLPPDSVPSPKLRAAIAALTGTFADPAYDYLFGGNNCTGRPVSLIAFQPPPNAPELLARSTRTAGGELIISISPRLAGERIEHLMPLLAHEAIHCDGLDGRFEEIAATAFDTLLYIRLLIPFPDLPWSETPLSRELNVDALAMLNSGRRIPESGGVLQSAGVQNALPGSDANSPSFADLVAASYPQLRTNHSPPEQLASAYAEILAQASGMVADDPFDLIYLDELIGRSFTADMILALLESFELVPT